MKSYILTIDGGTTNTRVCLWNQKHECVDIEKSEIGVRNTAIDGNNKKLADSIKNQITTLLKKNGLSENQISSIYASGMITSNVGLYELPHITAPASITDFANAIQTVSIPAVSSIPIQLIPGLKNSNSTNLSKLETMDIMRGEETECIALMSHYESKTGLLLVLPGSHNKFITVDKNQNITGCLTTLSGELLSVITNNTIIADAVNHSFAEISYNREMLLSGFRISSKCGLTRAAFSTRILNQFVSSHPNDCASYLLGSVLAADLEAVKHSDALQISPDTQVIIAGKEPLQGALLDIFREDGYFHHICTAKPMEQTPLAGYGALLISEHQKSLQKIINDR